MLFCEYACMDTLYDTVLHTLILFSFRSMVNPYCPHWHKSDDSMTQVILQSCATFVLNGLVSQHESCNNIVVSEGIILG